MRIVYTSDLRGNDAQYAKLFLFAAERKAHAVLLGGDLLPKRNITDFYIEAQAAWLGMLDAYIGQYRRLQPRGNVLLIMGDDDARVNLPKLRAVLDRHGAHNVHNTPVRAGDLHVVGLSCVPPSLSTLKDWELPDLAPASKSRARWDGHLREAKSVPSGLRSTPGGWDAASLPTSPSLEQYLASAAYSREPRKTVYVMHAAPARTSLDMAGRGVHVGSAAVREFIERQQPLVTLHAGVPGSVHVSGTFKTQIGRSFSYTAGNDGAGSGLAVICVDTDRPGDASRVLL